MLLPEAAMFWLVSGGVVLAAMLVWRLLRHRDEGDLGSVSTHWLATHRAGRRSIEQ
jgi:hypothetical protein